MSICSGKAARPQDLPGTRRRAGGDRLPSSRVARERELAWAERGVDGAAFWAGLGVSGLFFLGLLAAGALVS